MRAGSCSGRGRSRTGKTPSRWAGRKASVAVLLTIMMVVMVGFVALGVDVGYIASVRTELKRSTDAGALAGAGALVEGPEAAIARVHDFLGRNPVGSRAVDLDNVNIELGHWDLNNRSFSVSNQLPSAIRVRVDHVNQPLFFARIFGQEDFDLADESIAVYQPRDIVLVLDCSASMNDDSELRSIGKMGQNNVLNNLQQIYADLGSPTFGNMQWNQQLSSSATVSSIRGTLGLNNVAYPYPSGSWNDYIDYVKGNNGSQLPSAYRHRYGYLTFMNYLLEKQPLHSQTPVLWQTRQQPITALKNAVTVFLAYLQEVDTDDRLGLAIYTAADGTAVLEEGLTQNFSAIETKSRQRQAGHYDQFTNIGDGMKSARQEIMHHGRMGAFRMMVLMTDGIANRPNNESHARSYAIQEAYRAADAKIPIVTVSFGAGADTALMQQIADITGGVHFNVPGGSSVSQYEEDLKDVFRQIADDRPLKLVK